MDMAGLAFFDECTERVEEENGRNCCGSPTPYIVNIEGGKEPQQYILYVYAHTFV